MGYDPASSIQPEEPIRFESGRFMDVQSITLDDLEKELVDTHVISGESPSPVNRVEVRGGLVHLWEESNELTEIIEDFNRLYNLHVDPFIFERYYEDAKAHYLYERNLTELDTPVNLGQRHEIYRMIKRVLDGHSFEFAGHEITREQFDVIQRGDPSGRLSESPWQVRNYSIKPKVHHLDKKFPHVCFKCKKELKFEELFVANSSFINHFDMPLYRKLKNWWKSRFIEFYCCECYNIENSNINHF